MQHQKERVLEVLRSGFLADGRFYSIEITRLKSGRWEAGIACVPGDLPGEKRRSPTLRTAMSKDVLRRWAATLSGDEIERFVKAHYPLGLEPEISVAPERGVRSGSR